MSRDIFIDGVFQEDHTLDGYDIINDLPLEYGSTYVAKLLIRYDFETEPECLYEVFDNGGDDTITWLNDWYEGQDHIELLGIIKVDDIPDSCLIKINRKMDIRREW